MFLPAQTIRYLCSQHSENKKPLISPFSERAYFGGVSYGLGPASYDLRLDRDITLWPGKSLRADSIEEICMPNDLVGMMFSKSTWARIHIEHAGTLIDPGFEGVLRLEINMHHGDDIVHIKAGTGIVQVLFGRLESPTDRPYHDKYQHQGRDQDAIFLEK